MKRILRFFTVAVALLVSISFASAQNGRVFKTKAQVLGLKSGSTQVNMPVHFTSASRDALLTEGFDNEGVFPPDGWTQNILNTGNTWLQGNPEDASKNFSTIDPNSLYSALCPWVAEDQDEWLITSEVNANGETPLKLTWYAGVSGQWLNAATLKCLISTDDGANWTVLWDALDEIDPAADWGWNKVVINLDSYAGAPFKIAWQYVGNDGDMAGVDGVEIKSGYDYLFTDDFETYTTGQYVALDGDQDWWTTWTNSPGGSEDAEIKDNYSASATHSALLEDGTDLILKLGNKTSGKYQVNFKYYVPTDSAGYFNIQRFEEPGIEWAFEVYFAITGDGFMKLDGEQTGFFTYNHDEWIQIENIIDLSIDSAYLYVNGALVNTWQYTIGGGTLQLGGVDFYAGAPENEEDFSKVYLDDVEYIVLDEGAQAPEITVNPTDFTVVVESGTVDEEVLTIGNEGQQDLNYNIVATYDVGTSYAPIDSKIDYTIPKELNSKLSKVNISSTADAADSRDVVLNYDGEPFNAFGNQNADIQWRTAVVFRADMVKDYVGMDLSSVEVYIGDGVVTDFKLRVWKMGSYNVPGPGELIYEQSFTVTPAAWNTITLDTPVKLNGQDLWVGYYIAAPANNFVASTDDGTNYNPDGSWFASGPGWQHLGDGNPEYNLNWNIRAHLTGDAQEAWLSTDPTEGTVAPGETTDVNVTIDMTNVGEEGQLSGTLVVRSNDLANEWVEVPVSVAVFVGINENGEQGYVSMYPNPATAIVKLQANTTINSVEVYNAVGQMVLNTTVKGKTTSLDVSSLQNGVYFVKVNSELGTTTQKLIVK